MALKGTERLPKTARLLKRAEFLKLSRTGAKLQSASFTIISSTNHRPESRLGITVSSKVGNSVIRNRIKRQIREFFRRRRAALRSGMDILVIARKTSGGSTGASIANELERAFSHQLLRRGS
ncbi:MAG TPA: ribonuclease P protein component [Candidatus Binatia bacterium]|jgi:ribonuclease P protein component|nr:ribonuclease P protein component [Candidatus Binatia bacterium]